MKDRVRFCLSIILTVCFMLLTACGQKTEPKAGGSSEPAASTVQTTPDSGIVWRIEPPELDEAQGTVFLDILIHEKSSDRIAGYAVIRALGGKDSLGETKFSFAVLCQSLFVDQNLQFRSVSPEGALAAAAW